MGQPTSGVTQRVGRTQLWQYVPLSTLREFGYAEQAFRYLLGTRLALLFFQSLIFTAQFTP
jgi:hypothetical protein